MPYPYGLIKSPSFPVHQTKSAAPDEPLGSLAIVDGCIFALSKAGAVALTRGLVVKEPAVVANHLDCTVVTGALGSRQLTVTLGATLATEDQYKWGTAIVRSDGPSGSLSEQHRIRTHLAAASAANLTLELDTDIQVALDTSTKVDLMPNRFNGTLVMPTSQAGCPSGVPKVAVPIGYYYWGLLQGQGPCVADENLTRGQGLVAGTGVAGELEVQDALAEFVFAICASNAIAADDAGDALYFMPL